LIEDPDPAAIAELDAVFEDPPSVEINDSVELLEETERRFRSELADFWTRVASAEAELPTSRGHVFARLRLALLQGQVGVLCASGRDPGATTGFSLLLGLRVLIECAVHAEGSEPSDDEWLVDDEIVALLAVAPDGSISDFGERLLQGGLLEVPQALAARRLGPESLDYLARQKRALEQGALDGLPLAAWRREAPVRFDQRLAVAQREGERLAQERSGQIAAEWERARVARRERLEKRLEAAADNGADEAALAGLDAAIANVQRRRVSLRHDVLVTQVVALLE
jgi:hypothetical protein